LTDAELEGFLDAAAAAVALPIAAEHRPGVLHYLRLASSYAEMVNAHPLAIEDEPGSVFIPVSPPSSE